ncbi:MAG: ATP-binding cassette, subfamily bacterial PglK, partial [Candidatus Poribacteria bacterium]|nr:ATP-binding cassette, subfamily bacterial PglK [Candidatus Poribacteria bacterium]
IAVIETLGVSVIMPFLTLANDLALIHSNVYFNYVYTLLSFENEKSFILTFGVAILVFYLVRALANSLYSYLVLHFINSRYDLIVNKLFVKYLSLPYKSYIKHNTSSLTKVIINEAANITELFWFVLSLLSEVLVFLFIYSILMYVNFKITLSISLLLVIIGFFIKVIISQKMKHYGAKREEHQKIFYEILNRSFNNIKMIKLHSNDNNTNDFSLVSKEYVNTRIMSSALQQFPRFIFEFIGFSVIVLIVLYAIMQKDANNADLLSLVSVFVLGLYRILPSITRIFLSYNTILFQYKSLDIIHNDLNLDVEILGIESIEFEKTIHLDNISFSYDYQTIISNLNLTIEKNDKIAFIGESGSGKSTLVDIIMGLHQVTEGHIYIDDTLLSDENLISWRDHFGYIPQSVYLFDGTVAQNVAFGAKIEEEKVIESLEKANIWEFLKDKNGLNTQVGESGVMLSGGQKQRIAIARALYKDPDILVLDEATSALDDETEAKIMNEIYELARDKTLIIIAHRLSTIKRCNKIYTIDNGAIKNV